MDQRINEVMTPAPRCLEVDDTVADAARVMRMDNIGDVLVCSDGRLVGIVTDRDLVVRALAEDSGDPRARRLADVCSRSLTMVSSQDLVDDAITLMRERAIRRIPVVDNGHPVGVVSIGDLAIERDGTSALADISAAPANV